MKLSFIPLDVIIVGTRQRKDLGDLSSLINSIATKGLINPIILDESFNLIAGERRLRAYQHLAKTSPAFSSIPARIWSDLSPSEQHIIELEENVKRKDLSWQEQVDTIWQLHEAFLAAKPTWTQAETARELNYSVTQINDILSVARLAVKKPELWKAPKLSSAILATDRILERQIDDDIASALHVDSTTTIPADQSSVIRVDFTEWANTFTGQKFNLLHCDFPYGIEHGTTGQSGGLLRGSYEDSASTFWSLVRVLYDSMDMFMLPSAHMFFWFPMQKYYETYSRLTQLEAWEIFPIPLIWHKSDNTGILSDPSRRPRHIYEACFFASRGDRKIIRSVGDTYACPSPGSRHISEKPEPMLRHFFRMVVDENTRLLDPTCGSGTALRAAESLGASFVLGFDTSAEYVDYANTELKKSRQLRTSATADA
jgi:ParB/RepB/Spo0J family partition protein